MGRDGSPSARAVWVDGGDVDISGGTLDTLIGAVGEAAPATDIAASGLNGRLKRIAQRLTSLIGQFPTVLGQTTKAASLSIVPASDYQMPVDGTVAAAAADSGNPVKVGGKYNVTLPTYVDGQRGNLQIEANGIVRTSLYGFGAAQADTAMRIPVIIRSSPATASGNTTLWTPASGKKFRLMRIVIQVTHNAAQTAAGVLKIEVRDGTTDVMLAVSIFVPDAAATTFGSGWSSGWMDFGNGRLSATANNAVNLNLSAALTAGTVRAVVCGTEETP